MNKFVRDCFTGIDGVTWQLARVLIGLGALVLLVGGSVMILGIVHDMRRGHFDAVTFATALGAYAGAYGGFLMAGGGALWAQRSVEPQTVVATQTVSQKGSTEAATQIVETGK